MSANKKPDQGTLASIAAQIYSRGGTMEQALESALVLWNSAHSVLARIEHEEAENSTLKIPTEFPPPRMCIDDPQTAEVWDGWTKFLKDVVPGKTEGDREKRFRDYCKAVAATKFDEERSSNAITEALQGSKNTTHLTDYASDWREKSGFSNHENWGESMFKAWKYGGIRDENQARKLVTDFKSWWTAHLTDKRTQAGRKGIQKKNWNSAP